MDETLLRHDRDFRALVVDLHARFESGLNGAGVEKFGKAVWDKALDMWHMMFDGALPGSVARRYSIVNALRQLEADLDLADPMIAYWDELTVANTGMMPHAESILTRLREQGVRTGIVTNGYSEVQRLKINHHKLESMVDFVLVSEEARSHKPDVGIFNQAMKLADATPDSTAFIGDMPQTDIEGARAAGMHSILIDPKDSHMNGLPAHQQPTYRIRCLSELFPLLGLDSR
jgi:HAD superfamily hydrolase (TIGR01662 family)